MEMTQQKIQTKNEFTDTDSRMMVTRGEWGWRRTLRVKGVKYKVMEGDESSDGKPRTTQ